MLSGEFRNRKPVLKRTAQWLPGTSAWLWMLLCLQLLLASAMWAQVDRGTMTGTVKDPSGAAIPNVTVSVTNNDTGAKYSTVSNELGIYYVRSLPIGNYQISFKKDGFKEVTRSGLTITIAQVMELNPVMQIGSAQEVITVTAESPILQTESASLGTNVRDNAIKDLPLSAKGGRNILAFAYSFTPTVVGSSWDTYIANSQPMTKAVLIDGTSFDSGIVGFTDEAAPSMEAIEEFQVDTSGIRAESARTGGGTFMFNMKSGTNKFHGSAFGFMGNEILDANKWDNNWFKGYCKNPANAGDKACAGDLTRYDRGKNRYFDYGFSAGGPIIRNKTFIFGAFERYRNDDFRLNPLGATVPTSKMLSGDFSELLNTSTVLGTDAAGRTIYKGSIFNPITGNVIPGNLFANDPTLPAMSARAQKIVNIYKTHYQPQNGNLTGNYPSLSATDPWLRQSQFDLKFDHNFSDKHHFSSSYIYTNRPRKKNEGGLWEVNTTDGGPFTQVWQQSLISNAYRVQDSYSITPTVLNVLSLTYNEFNQSYYSISSKQKDWAKELGLSDVTNGYPNFPEIDFGDKVNGYKVSSIGGNRTDGSGYVAYNTLLNDSISWMKGRHSLKFGGEIRKIGLNKNGDVDGPVSYTFSNLTGVNPSWSDTMKKQVGYGFANFLLGQVDSAGRGTAFNQHGGRMSYSLFVQDDIKVNSRLTISADLRWDANGRLHENDGKWTNFDVNATNPAFSGYKGALTWAQRGSDSFEKNQNYHQFGPHIGASYQLTDKLVARGSYGIFYVPLGNNSYAPVPYGFAIGYQASDSATKNASNTPKFNWDTTAYPMGTYYRAASAENRTSAGQGSYLPWGVVSIDPDSLTLGRTQNWNLGVQYQLAKDTRIEVSYIGNIGRKLHDGYLNPTFYPTWDTYSSYLKAGANLGDWIWDAGSAKSAGVPYPYAGFSGNAWMAIMPYPQVGPTWGPIYFVNSPIGKSDYNAFVIQGTKRGGHGITFDMSYTLSRSRGNAGSAMVDSWSGYGKGYQDPYAYDKETSYGTGQEHILKGYVLYDLPFGQGKRFLRGSKMLDKIVGGWSVNMGVSYASGNPMSAVKMGPELNQNGAHDWSTPGWSAIYANVAENADFSRTFKKVNLAWDPSKGPDPNSMFVNTSIFSNPAFATFGNSPTKYSNWHNFGWCNEDLSLLKRVSLRADGRYKMTLRADFFNVFNRHHWADPNMDANSGYFGHITAISKNSNPRQGQLGARFEW